jgi:hypothetical protein
VQGGTMTLPANSGINFNTDQLFLSGRANLIWPATH